MQDLWPNAYVHSLSPFLLRFTEHFGIRWYGISYLAGFLIGYWFILWLAKRRLTVVQPEQVSDFVFTVAVGTIVGGRLGYCLFYAPELFSSFSAAPPFWGVLAINQGGMASHGGILGVALACLWFARTRKLPLLPLLDLNTIGGALGIFFGRIANFVNSELIGRPAPAGFGWAVKFPKDILLWPSSEPHRLASLTPAVQNLGISEQRWNEIAATPMLHRETLNSILGTLVERVETGDLLVKGLLAPALTGLIVQKTTSFAPALNTGAAIGIVAALLYLVLVREPITPRTTQAPDTDLPL
ncbi:MAG: prolipoprotein diacylglyceryl transferase [Proteobacteria bacterium]|nr:prolipoprotein diacylglyceryl transferase [Pseudomonadota bacterium]